MSKSIRNLVHNEEGSVVSEDLELFLGNTQSQTSVGNYVLDRNYDLSGNLLSLNTRGGLPREVLSKVAKDNITGYSSSYLAGTSTLKNMSFVQNGVTSSIPLTGVNSDSEGYITNIHLENNLELASAWHARKQVPLAFGWEIKTKHLHKKI